MTNRPRGVLYTGVTNNLVRRVQEHHKRKVEGFTCKYKTHILVHYEVTTDIHSAISYEKKLKNWKRNWKIDLVEKNNPTWKDLYPEICGKDPGSSPG